MVECEYVTNLAVGRVYLVLIDTWWNVNSIAFTFAFLKPKVLIDTWWNVNIVPHALQFYSYVF